MILFVFVFVYHLSEEQFEIIEIMWCDTTNISLCSKLLWQTIEDRKSSVILIDSEGLWCSPKSLHDKIQIKSWENYLDIIKVICVCNKSIFSSMLDGENKSKNAGNTTTTFLNTSEQTYSGGEGALLGKL